MRKMNSWGRIETTGSRTLISPAVGIAILLGLAAPLFFFRLGVPALLDPDEPYYAVPALEMLRSGSWMVPIFHGQAWFDKPVLFYWIVLAGYRLFGESEFAARIGSALAATAGVLAFYGLLRRWRPGPVTALTAAVILATSIEYAFLARAAVTDMTLTLFMTLGMLAMACCLKSGLGFHSGLAGCAFGLATLAKGPVGLILPGVALLLYSLVGRRADMFRRKTLFTLAAGILLSAGPWYVYMALSHIDLLMKTFLGEGNLGRFLHPEHSSFPLYYVVILALGLLPWSAALPAALAHAIRPGHRADEIGGGREPGTLYTLCWFAAVVGVFWLSASKLPSYILPAFPPAALLLAGYWTDTLRSERNDRGAALTGWLGVALACAVAGAILLSASKPQAKAALTSLLAMAFVFIVGSLLAVAAIRKRSLPAFVTVQAGAAVAAMLLFTVFTLPRIEALDSTRPLARELRLQGIDADVVGAYLLKDISLDYYLGRSLPRTSDRGDLRKMVAANPGGLWIVKTPDLLSLGADHELVVRDIVSGPRRSAVRLSPALLPQEATR